MQKCPSVTKSNVSWPVLDHVPFFTLTVFCHEHIRLTVICGSLLQRLVGWLVFS